jgi:hypothetical protein
MKIYIKTLTGKTLYIEISKTDKVDSLRHKIYDLEGIPPDA